MTITAFALIAENSHTFAPSIKLRVKNLRSVSADRMIGIDSTTC